MPPFLMSREIFSHEVASPHTRQSEKGAKMNKSKKLQGSIALCQVAFNNLMELSEALRIELKTLFRALEINDEDAEKIEDEQLYKIALDLQYNAEEIESESEDLANVIKYLEKLKI